VRLHKLSASDTYKDDLDPKKKLDDLIHLAELCIEVLQQNEEHHADVGCHDYHCCRGRGFLCCYDNGACGCRRVCVAITTGLAVVVGLMFPALTLSCLSPSLVVSPYEMGSIVLKCLAFAEVTVDMFSTRVMSLIMLQVGYSLAKCTFYILCGDNY